MSTPSPSSPPSVRQALQQAQQVGLARVDAQILLLHAMGQNPHHRAWLIANDEQVLDREQNLAFEGLMTRRLRHEPVAYLLGFHEFFGLQLQVDRRVLDPRPDTETLVEWALALLAEPALPTDPAKPPVVIDLGTGSGAIACAIAAHAPHATVWASDASHDALAVAQANAAQLGLAIRFAHGSWLQAVPLEAQHQFALIVSNPPYLRSDDPHLAALAHEPLSALASGADGLDDIRALVAQAPARLAPGGWLLLEHGYDQADAVQMLLRQAGFKAVQSRRDLAGVARCSGGQWPGLDEAVADHR